MLMNALLALFVLMVPLLPTPEWGRTAISAADVLPSLPWRSLGTALDNLAGRSDDPLVPQLVIESELEKARIYSLMTDFDAKEIKIGMPVEMTFRRIYEGAGMYNYFWKCRPVR